VSGELALLDVPVHPFYFAVGLTYSCAAWMLLPAGFANLFTSGERTWFTWLITGVAWILVACSAVILYAYAHEAIAALLSESPYERSQFRYRLTGSHAWMFWTEWASALLPQVYWIPAVRKIKATPLALGLQALVVFWLLRHPWD
jgi:hypothetical protein